MPMTGRPAAAWCRTARSSPRDAQPGEIGDRGARARQHDDISAAEVLRLAGEHDVHARLEAQGIDVGEVADARHPDHRDPKCRIAIGRPPALQVEGVLGVEPHIGAPGQHAEDPAPGQRLEPVEPGLEQRLVAAELVDDEPGDEPLVFGLEQRHRAVHRREHPAPVDVTDHDRRDVGMPGETHVDVVARSQVDLCRTAGALAHHDVEARRQVVVCRVGRRRQVRTPADELRRRDLAGRLTHDDHVALAVTARLEQHGVHGGLGDGAGGQRLDPLGPADLRARTVADGSADHRVVGHVLRLVGRDLEPATGEGTAQPGRDDALAGVRGRAGDQQRTAHGVCTGLSQPCSSCRDPRQREIGHDRRHHPVIASTRTGSHQSAAKSLAM